MILLTCSASMAAMACGGDPADDPGDGGGSATGGEGGSGNAGGSEPGVGGSGGGVGGMAPACGVALMARGSNYGSDPHDLMIPLADIEAGVTKTYATTGTSHTHDVTVTDADFAALRNGEVVKLYTCFSSPSLTDHEFILDCGNPDNTSMLDGELGDESMCG